MLEVNLIQFIYTIALFLGNVLSESFDILPIVFLMQCCFPDFNFISSFAFFGMIPFNTFIFFNIKIHGPIL